MKSSYTIISWSKKDRIKRRRLRLMGALFILLALSLSLFALAAFSNILPDALSLTSEEQEGFYMMALVFFVMGLFCQTG